MLALFIIIGTLISVPLTYTYAFLLIELPKKLGYFKFVLILICYIFFCGIMVFLLSESYLDLILFFILLILPDLLGVYYLRREFIDTIKRDFQRNRKGTRNRKGNGSNKRER